jgi:hypothetical protein
MIRIRYVKKIVIYVHLTAEDSHYYSHVNLYTLSYFFYMIMNYHIFYLIIDGAVKNTPL